MLQPTKSLLPADKGVSTPPSNFQNQQVKPQALRAQVDLCSIEELPGAVHAHLEQLFGVVPGTTVGEGATTWGGLQPVYVTTVLKSPAPSFVLSRSVSKFVNPAYADFLGSINIDTKKALKFELLGFKAYSCPNKECGVGGIFLPVISCGRYHPHVSNRHSSRCVARAMEKIEFIEEHTPADYLIKLDLTVPGWVSKSLCPGDLKLLRLAVNIFLRLLAVPRVNRHSSELGGFYSIHTWKTTKPLEPHLHVHLNVFSVAYNRKDKTFHRFKPLLDHLAVKHAWRKSLRSVGLWDNPVKSALPDCHLGYIKLADRVRLMSRIRYIFRKPIVDMNKNIGNCDTSHVDPVWARALLDYTPRQVFVGWAVNLKRFGFKCSSKSVSPLCPCCGTWLEFEYRLKEIPPDIPWFTIDQGGGLVETPPLGG